MLPLDEHLRTQLDLLHLLYPDVKKVREEQERLAKLNEKKDLPK